MESKLYYSLLEIIEKQDEIIYKQKQTIFRLVNENCEKENMINELMKEIVADYRVILRSKEWETAPIYF